MISTWNETYETVCTQFGTCFPKIGILCSSVGYPSILLKGISKLYKGHCWSDESHYPPLEHPRWQVFPSHSSLNQTRVHPSNAPKCTHAYALSKKGARRLWSHLSYYPFAYSRAIDQAFAWLIVSGRLQSYSIVPSLVVQRKIEGSDIVTGTKGSRWKDSLHNGVFNDTS